MSVRTLRQHLHHPAHPLPHYRIGGKILVKRSEFDTWAGGFRAATSDRIGQLVADVLKGL
jgi:hypothetical protein